MARQITSTFKNKLGYVFSLFVYVYVFLLNGEVIWHASDSSLSKELLATMAQVFIMQKMTLEMICSGS